MTEGGIAQWKVKEGDSFAPGDVLLEIVRISLFIPSCRDQATDRDHHPILRLRSLSLDQETDKATMDVEAQDEGVLGKILVRSPSLSRTKSAAG
jgi:pyruvate dehydrogenase E2 component (dihydrolipoamide acetyltransferase)